MTASFIDAKKKLQILTRAYTQQVLIFLEQESAHDPNFEIHVSALADTIDLDFPLTTQALRHLKKFNLVIARISEEDSRMKLYRFNRTKYNALLDSIQIFLDLC